MQLYVRPMSVQDIPSVRILLDISENLCLEVWETDDVLCDAVRAHPGLSQVAVNVESNELIGAVFLGSTGLRVNFQHLAVAPKYQRQGVGHAMIEGAIAAVRQHSKVRRLICSVFVMNYTAIYFWRSTGFTVTSGLDGEVAFLMRDI